VRIKDATAGDLASLARLMGAATLLRRYALTTAGARAALREALRERDIVLVAHDAGGVVGLAWVIATRALDRSAYLRLLLVADGERSRGLGAALLARAEGRARNARCRHLALLVTKTNRRARAFYVRHGYRHVGDMPGFVRPRIDEALYVKRLSRRPVRRASAATAGRLAHAASSPKTKRASAGGRPGARRRRSARARDGRGR